MCIIDRKTLKFLQANNAILDQLGYSRKEILSKSVLEVLIPSRSRAFGEQFWKSKKAQPQVSRWQLRRRNRSLIEMQVAKSSLRFNGRLAYLLNLFNTKGFAEDDPGPSLEEEIVRHRSELKAILDYSPSMFFLKDSEGRYLLVNREFEDRFRLDLDDILGKTDNEIFHHEQAVQFRTHDRLVLESGKATEFEEQALYGDGLHTSIVTKYPLLDSSGRVASIGGIVTDITERKRAEKALHASERTLRDFLYALPTAVYVCDSSGTIESYNKRAVELWGREPKMGDETERFCGSHRIYTAEGAYVPHAESPTAHVLQTGIPISGQSIVIERPDGSRRDAMVDIIPRRDESGRLTGAINCLTDITKLAIAEEKFKGLLEAAPDAMIIADQNGTIRIINSQVDNLFGYQRRELVGRSLDVLVPERFRGRHPIHRSSYISNPVKRTMGAGLQLYGLRKDGSEFPVDVSLSPFETEEGLLVISAIRDISDQRKSALELQETHDRLRALGARLESIREEEKERIAREVHDELGQLLTALKMDLTLLSQEVHGSNHISSIQIIEALDGMQRLTDTAIQRTRDITAELRPPILDHLGLKPAVEWLAAEWQKRTKIESSVKANVDEIVLDRERSTAAFRIIQEALSNVGRHSEATKAGIHFEQQEDRLTIGIWDNGKGIAVEQMLDIRSLGIFGMKERAALIGGEVHIKPLNGGGTEVLIVFPRNGEREDSQKN
jgi:PAS domain S-box-containing protein